MITTGRPTVRFRISNNTQPRPTLTSACHQPIANTACTITSVIRKLHPYKIRVRMIPR